MSIALTTAWRLLRSNEVDDETFCKVTTDEKDMFINPTGDKGDLEVGRAERAGAAVENFEGFVDGLIDGATTGGGENMEGSLVVVGLELTG